MLSMAPRRTVFLPYRPKTILNRHKRIDFWFWSRYSANPYIGCQHGCEFCFYREEKYSQHERPEDFAYEIKVKENAAELLRRELRGKPVDLIFTGDYQAAERKFGLSRRMLEVCRDLGFPVFILERSPLVLRDLDLLADIQRGSRAVAAFSAISTPDAPHHDAVTRIEHLSQPAEKRFAAMAKIAAAGILTGTSFMPALPELCDDRQTIDSVVRWTAEHGGSFVLAATLTLADQQRSYFFRYLAENLPGMVAPYRALYPAGSYGPTGGPGGYEAAWRRLGLRVREACEKYGIRDRVPRPIIPGEKRALNKRVVEALADELYALELEAAPAAQQWALRKAAWAIEELEQDIGLVYRTMGVKGLAAIPDVGAALAGKIETYLKSDEVYKK